MTSAMIHDLPDWQVWSHGNGLAYAIVAKSCGARKFFQGDDAEQFREQFEALTEGTPSLDFADALRVIWHDYAEIAA